jgi:hypothetical protein
VVNYVQDQSIMERNIADPSSVGLPHPVFPLSSILSVFFPVPL